MGQRSGIAKMELPRCIGRRDAMLKIGHKPVRACTPLQNYFLF
jgi:hypothetical protein